MSTSKVLVAYGTKNGSTAGIADMIAATLMREGVEAEARPAGTVRDVTPYRAVVLGGALYSGRWHGQARRFARRHAAALRERPVWLFSSGPLSEAADSADVPPVRAAAEAARLLGAREHVTFGGRLTAESGGFVARAMLRNGRAGDWRNPERIAEWAGKIAAELR
ncbi:flavodoxin domain-containing protein [Actinomadura sp. ATCC 31491]|uniref:Flavodoxin domain-containing protein n=1 Tax=Actinomadura luzonensis TaxID=2805427 RepID=A0ABT0G4D7_9ACTN|nr:flavodoxin domain-containing protein [Actinomadura luzonensis]MCK2219458.1 flavodoxin domain-containing protein [Actinomadura luzonensis]